MIRITKAEIKFRLPVLRKTLCYMQNGDLKMLAKKEDVYNFNLANLCVEYLKIILNLNSPTYPTIATLLL